MFLKKNSSKSLCSCESCSALYIAEFARTKITEERHSRLESQEHGKTVPMKHKLKGRIQVRKGRTKEDEEDGKEMLGVCTSVCVSCCLLSSLNSRFVEGMDALLMGRVGGCLGVYMTHRSLSLSFFNKLPWTKKQQCLSFYTFRPDEPLVVSEFVFTNHSKILSVSFFSS